MCMCVASLFPLGNLLNLQVRKASNAHLYKTVYRYYFREIPWRKSFKKCDFLSNQCIILLYTSNDQGNFEPFQFIFIWVLDKYM